MRFISSSPDNQGSAANGALRFFVASVRLRDLLLHAKHLLVAAMTRLGGGGALAQRGCSAGE